MFYGVRLQLLAGLNLPITAAVVPLSPQTPHVDPVVRFQPGTASSPLRFPQESPAAPWYHRLLLPSSPLPVFVPHKRGASENILDLLSTCGPLYPRRIAAISQGNVDPGSVYSQLKRMETKGWVKAVGWESGLGKGPDRRIYEVTDAGRAALKAKPPRSPKIKLILELFHVHGECYGDQLVTLSEGHLELKSIYVLLGRMEDRGLIRTTRTVPGERGTRRYYEITEMGLAALLPSLS